MKDVVIYPFTNRKDEFVDAFMGAKDINKISDCRHCTA
jgi:hypothetical protein